MTEVIKVAPCPTCGRELNYVEQYGQYYCYTCQQYHQPGAQAAPPPPPPPPPPVHGPPPGAPRSKTPLLIAGVVIIVIIIILAAVFLLITPEEEGDTVTMDMNDLRKNFTADGLKNLTAGDTIYVEDEIIYMADKYDEDYETTVTYIWLESAHGGESLSNWRVYDYSDDEYDYINMDFTIEGDITDEYDTGDKIRITLNVIIIDDNGETREFFDEMWDGKKIVPLLESIIKLLQDDNGEEEVKFPTLDIALWDNGPAETDSLRVKHLQGDPLDWSDYKIIITNNTNDFTSTMVNLNSLGTITAGDTSRINNTIPGFTGINYSKATSYMIEIYNLKENKRVYYLSNLICQY
jgi:hypothetical protein